MTPEEKIQIAKTISSSQTAENVNKLVKILGKEEFIALMIKPLFEMNKPEGIKGEIEEVMRMAFAITFERIKNQQSGDDIINHIH
ncbi:MAG TPA: hypothetical protein VGP43_02500 [Chitinophagaceae bacterium]|nr:hypothetical protein [Chitinophagaceae bacterium]